MTDPNNTANDTDCTDTPTDTFDIDLFDELEPGESPVVQPRDDIELVFHGLSPRSGGAMMIEATLFRDHGGDSFYLYMITDIVEDDDGNERFVVEPDGPRNTDVEDAIESFGGTVNAPV